MLHLLDPLSLLTILVGFLIWYFVRLWLKIRSLPPGPFPLPIVGNLLSFRSSGVTDVTSRWRRKYGDIYTMWLGQTPFLLVSDRSLFTEALVERRNDFSGRPQFHINDLFMEGNLSISAADYTPEWDTLHKMAIAAIRKYAVGAKLPSLVDDLTGEAVKKMLQETEPFHPKDYIYHLIFNITASAVFGQRYKADDPEFVVFLKGSKCFEDFANSGLIADFIPVVRPFYIRSERKFLAVIRNLKAFALGKLKQHAETYQNGCIRDMIDSLLSAREEVIAKGREKASYLHDGNLVGAIMDIFTAGVDITSMTIRWVLLELATFPDLQDKVIDEIQKNIGDRVPVQEDKKLCPLTSAVIMETLRLRDVAPFGLPHSTIRDTSLGGYTLPKGTIVVFHWGAVHNNPLQWKEPEMFQPQRFLGEDGLLTEARMTQYVPFGQGRRSCVGEKLALANVFMVVVGILRRCRLVLKEPPIDFESDTIQIFQIPKKHTMTASPLKP